MPLSNQQICSHVLPNGMTIVGEIMPWLESAAFSFFVPSGCQHDPPDKLGLANFACEMVQRGCGKLDSRQYIEKLESLGVDYSSSASVYHTHFSGAMPASHLHDAFAVYADVFCHPWLPEDQLEDGRQVCYQEIRAIEDDLSQRVMLQLKLRQYGQPRGRWSQGTIESVASIEQSDIQQFVADNYQPNGMILSVAGNIEWDELVATVENLFGNWSSRPAAEIVDSDVERGEFHIAHESQQVHIALACPTLTYNHPDYFLARGAVGVLSDGMSSRLFHELREKRGLCYSVFASLHSLLNQASIVSYVGTSAERAQQSLDALAEQLSNLALGIEQFELDRLKIQIRSSLIMQQESSRARAAAIAGDWFHLGKARTLEEISSLINGLTVERINAYLKDNPLGPFNLVTLGPRALELKHEISAAPTG